jgi:hypothetical protein
LKGEERAVGYSSLTSNCLCAVHNSRLSSLDAAAGQFFAAIKDVDLHRGGPGKDFLFSGHDVERWMLKTLANIIASKTASRGGERLLGALHPRVSVAEMLEHPKNWASGTGLYFAQRLGEQLFRDDHFWLEPISIREPAEFCGMKVSVQGLEFLFLAVSPDTVDARDLYRPGRMAFIHQQTRNIIELSWVDMLAHGPIELTFTGTAGDFIASGKPMPPNTIRRPEEFSR